MQDGYVELRELYTRVGGRRRSVNWYVYPIPGGALDEALRFEWRARRCESATNGSWLLLDVQVETALFFAAFGPDPLGGFTRDAGRVAGIPVFVDQRGRELDPLRAWASTEAHSHRLAGVPLGKDEGLVARTSLSARFRPVGVERHLRLLDALVDLAEVLPADDEPDVETVLPEGLAPLQTLIGRWAVDDDEERAELIEEADTEELRRLIAAVEPHLHAIDRLFTEDETAPAALVTGRLAEAALEARQELRRRMG